MEILDKETQSLAVEKVFEEMKLAEEYLKSWGVSWSEYFSDAYITPYYGHYVAMGEEKEKVKDFNEILSTRSYFKPNEFECFLNDHINISSGHYYGKDIIKDFILKEHWTKDDIVSLLSHTNIIPSLHIPECMGNYVLASGHINDDSIGKSLKNETLITEGNSIEYPDKLIVFLYIYEVKFGRITWGDINSHGSQRRIIFNNDGTIELDKQCNLRPKRVKYIDYTISFNVLSNDFDMSFNVSGDKITVSLKGDTLGGEFNNIEITKNLNDDSPLEEQAEKSLIEIIKSIRGEIPLPGLVNRIDNFLERIDKNYKTQKSNKKVLKLELPTNN